MHTCHTCERWYRQDSKNAYDRSICLPACTNRRPGDLATSDHQRKGRHGTLTTHHDISQKTIHPSISHTQGSAGPLCLQCPSYIYISHPCSRAPRQITQSSPKKLITTLARSKSEGNDGAGQASNLPQDRTQRINKKAKDDQKLAGGSLLSASLGGS